MESKTVERRIEKVEDEIAELKYFVDHFYRGDDLAHDGLEPVKPIIQRKRAYLEYLKEKLRYSFKEE